MFLKYKPIQQSIVSGIDIAILQIYFKKQAHFLKKNFYFCPAGTQTQKMIQRIQTVYLLGVVLVNGALPFWVHLWTGRDGEAVYAINDMSYSLLFLSSAILAFLTVFLYKSRKRQFVLNRLNLILNLILLGIFVYRSLILPGENIISEKGIGMLLPVLSIVFLVLANKAIKRDEALVKSVDRLR